MKKTFWRVNILVKGVKSGDLLFSDREHLAQFMEATKDLDVTVWTRVLSRFVEMESNHAEHNTNVY